ncbi:MAG: DNA alkylation repair protein [Thermoguttaceae bacterium]
MANILKEVQKTLKANADEQTRVSGRRFFKEEVKLYGVKTATVTILSKQLFTKYFGNAKEASKDEVFMACDELWKSGVLEETFIACNWTYRFAKQFFPSDFKIFEDWVSSYIKNWASCDTFCNHSVGTFLEMYPKYLPELKIWAASPNLWKRRASAVSLIVPAKRGLFHKEVFQLAKILLHDTEDMVQKGYGWMLKVTSQANDEAREAVFDFVMKHKKTMPRTALRYAIEKMPKDMKVKAMEK